MRRAYITQYTQYTLYQLVVVNKMKVHAEDRLWFLMERTLNIDVVRIIIAESPLVHTF